MPTVTLKARLATIVEKAVWTYVQALIGLYVANSATDLNIHTWQVWGFASLPAMLTVLVASTPSVPVGLPFYQDLALRVLRTFGTVFVSTVAVLIPIALATVDVNAGPNSAILNSVGKGALAAGVAAVVAVVKGAAVQKVGQPGTPASLPASVDASASAPAVAPCP